VLVRRRKREDPCVLTEADEVELLSASPASGAELTNPLIAI